MWKRFGQIPINNNGEIQKRFLHFPVGTNREDVWHWFEDQDKNFSVAKEMYATN